MSLLSVLISLSLSLVALTFVARLQNVAALVVRAGEQSSDLEDLRQQLRRSISCRETIAALTGTCPTSGYINVYGYRTTQPPAILIKRPTGSTANPSGYSSWSRNVLIRARCAPCTSSSSQICPGNRQLIVEVNRVSSDGRTLLAAPITKRALDGSAGGRSSVGLSQGWTNLFRRMPLGCAMP